MGAYTRMVTWDRLLEFMRPAFPALSCYGVDKGGSAPELIRCLRNEELVERVAERLFGIDCAYQAKIRPLVEKINEASKARAKAEKQMREDLMKESQQSST